jgi:hypothetical protein
VSSLVLLDGEKLPTVKRESKLAKNRKPRGSKLRRIATNTNGTFKRIVNGEQIGKAIRGKIDVIVVGHLDPVSREFYKKKFDPDAKATLPDCWSNLGDKPDPKAPNPQGKSCESCKQNVVGSGTNGKGRACRFKRRLAVLAVGDPSGDVYQMSFAATSLFGEGSDNAYPFEGYVNYLEANGEFTDTVVTRVMYDDDSDTMKFKFAPVRHLTEEEAELVDAAQEDGDTEKYYTLTVAQAEGVSKKPTDSDEEDEEEEAEEEETEEVEEEEDDDEEEEEEPAPKRRAAKPKPASTGKASGKLTKTIEEWLDDEDDD